MRGTELFSLRFDCDTVDEYICAGDDDADTVRAFNAFRKIYRFIDYTHKQDVKTTEIIQDTIKNVKEGKEEYSCLKFTPQEIAKLKELKDWCGKKGVYDYRSFLVELIDFLEAVQQNDEEFEDETEIIHKPGTEFTDAEIEQIRYVEKWYGIWEYHQAVVDTIINFCEEILKSKK